MALRRGASGLVGLAFAPLRLAAGGVDLALSTTAAATRALTGIAVETLGGEPARRRSTHGRRQWIEVRGLSGPDAEAIADEVLDSVRAVPGVIDAVVNHSVARVVVTVAPEGPHRDLAAVVGEAERRARTEPPTRHSPLTLPGDDVALLTRALAAAASTAGLGFAVTGAAMRLPGLPNLLSIAPTLAEQIPAVRHELVRRLGNDGTDLAFALLNAAANALTLSPTAAAADAATRTLLAGEAWQVRRNWHRHESLLAQSNPEGRRPARGRTVFADGPGEQYANQAGWIGVSAAAAIAALSRNPAVGGAAALVAAPKPTRASREAFGCAMTRGLTGRHDAIVLRPRALRALDRVDTIVIDPRLLYTEELAVTRVRGVGNSARTVAWQAAARALAAGELGPGWHRLATIAGSGTRGEALISPVRDPLATAVVGEARKTGARVVSVKDDGLRSLGQGFDTLHPRRGSLDDDLAAVVSELRLAGQTVALLTTSDMAAQHEADLTVGVTRDGALPWGADVFVPDLAAVWRILHAVPAARSATARGVRLSISSSALGALMLIPGVPGYGPDAVNTGAFAGLWTGYTAAGKIFDDPAPIPEPGHEWHALAAEDVRRMLPRPEGLSEHPRPASPLLAPARLARQAGALAAELIDEIRSNLADPITPILATGAVASALLGSPLDAALVSSVLLTNATLSAQQQLHAARTLRRLLAVQDPPARRRIGDLAAGAAEEVSAEELRPGDVIEIRAGEVVPADARLIDVETLEVDESRLTGESLPVAKQTDPTPGAPLAERACMVYAGCTVVAGTALAVVTTVGRATEVRRAMSLTPKTSRAVGLHHQLARITNRALPWTLGGGAVVGLLSMLRGTPLREAVGSAVAVSVAAVPEGLPLVATLAQLASARALTSEHVLIRNANSIEALARVGVVCFDKTGTLSENRLRVTRVRPVGGRRRKDVLDAAASTIVAHDGRAQHATDEAIRVAAKLNGGPVTRGAVLPFQSGRPFAAALSGTRLTVKGAPESLSGGFIRGSTDLADMIEEMAAQGLRVLAVAERTLTARQAAQAAADPAVMERFCRARLTPVGLLGLADTPRSGAAALLTELGSRGIGVRLITGDHPVTAAAIATELGIAVTADQVITGSEWEALSADERSRTVTESVVFARMSPEHKVEVVQTLERIGVVTAMVGDGANDAAAIRAASVGIGVAAPGSDPARTAADMLLLDGRIDALIDAIDEGQQLWRRVQSAVSVLLGGNAGEVAFALITAIATGRSVLNARQMLLVNMLTDALPAAALAVSASDGTGAVDRDEAALWRAIAVRGTATTAGATLAWLMGRLTGTQRRAATIALIGLVSTQLAQTVVDSHSPLVVATAAGSFLTLAAIISTPGLSHLFGCTPVDPLGWGQAFTATAIASLMGVTAPAVLEWLAPTAEESVVDDDESHRDQDRVDLAKGGRQKAGPEVDEDLRSAKGSANGSVTTGSNGHKPRQARVRKGTEAAK